MSENYSLFINEISNFTALNKLAYLLNIPGSKIIAKNPSYESYINADVEILAIEDAIQRDLTPDEKKFVQRIYDCVYDKSTLSEETAKSLGDFCNEIFLSQFAPKSDWSLHTKTYRSEAGSIHAIQQLLGRTSAAEAQAIYDALVTMYGEDYIANTLGEYGVYLTNQKVNASLPDGRRKFIEDMWQNMSVCYTAYEKKGTAIAPEAMREYIRSIILKNPTVTTAEEFCEVIKEEA